MHTSSLELVLNYLLLNFPQIRAAKPLGNNNVWESRMVRRPRFVHRPRDKRSTECGSRFTTTCQQLPRSAPDRGCAWGFGLG